MNMLALQTAVSIQVRRRSWAGQPPGSCIYCSPVAAVTRNYTNNYKGVLTGTSSLIETYRQLGTPIKVEPAGKGYNYRFEKVYVNFAGKENAKVNTIIVDNDYQYIDHNGFKLGDKITDVTAKLRENAVGNTVADKNNGIIYWHNGKVIKRIVLAASLLVQ